MHVPAVMSYNCHLKMFKALIIVVKTTTGTYIQGSMFPLYNLILHTDQHSAYFIPLPTSVHTLSFITYVTELQMVQW